MAVFRWEGISPKGEVMRGEMEAMTRDAVIVRLRTQRIQPLPAKIREKGRGLDRQLTIPGLGVPDGNPPSGVASGYVWFDVMALLVAPALLRAARHVTASARDSRMRYGGASPRPGSTRS